MMKYDVEKEVKMNSKGIKVAVTELLIAMVMVAGFTAMAHANLSVVGTGTIDGGTTAYQLIYDSAQNITWLDYSNPAAIWSNQASWANNLSVDVISGPQNVTGWSLPTTVDNSSSGNNPPSSASSQMAYLYLTDLGDTTTLTGSGLVKTGPFKNLVSNMYWSGTAANSAGTGEAWGFSMSNGLNHAGSNGVNGYALAVLPGDIVTGGVVTPIPGTVLLFGTGLAGLIGTMKLKRENG